MRLTPDSEIQVWVRVHATVLGMYPGRYLLYPSARIEKMVRSGLISWDDPSLEE